MNAEQKAWEKWHQNANWMAGIKEAFYAGYRVGLKQANPLGKPKIAHRTWVSEHGSSDTSWGIVHPDGKIFAPFFTKITAEKALPRWKGVSFQKLQAARKKVKK